MGRYIDADELINKLDERCDAICQWTKKEREVMCGACPLATAFDVVEDFPTADVVEVVRCKDCKLFEQNGKKEFGNCPHHQCLAYLTDFCSWGERREDAEIH